MLNNLFLELTTRCALACPACVRTIYPGQYISADLSLDVIRNLAADKLQYRHIILSGNHGDPIYHPKFHEILKILVDLPGSPSLGISTNGSYRDEVWWRETASILRRQDSVTFGADGLQDTAKIYRVNMDWDSVVRGMRTLKSFGQCMVVWQWILFRHNQHQLVEAREVCDSLGIDKFEIVLSFRDAMADKLAPTITLKEAYEQFRQKDLSPM